MIDESRAAHYKSHVIITTWQNNFAEELQFNLATRISALAVHRDWNCWWRCKAFYAKMAKKCGCSSFRGVLLSLRALHDCIMGAAPAAPVMGEIPCYAFPCRTGTKVCPLGRVVDSHSVYRTITGQEEASRQNNQRTCEDGGFYPSLAACRNGLACLSPWETSGIVKHVANPTNYTNTMSYNLV